MSQNAISDLCKDEKYCKEEILRIREMFGNKNSTQKHFEAAEQSLILMLIHCPEHLYYAVQATIDELSRRKVHFAFHIWESPVDVV